MDKNCGNCEYFRLNKYCSNSKSPRFIYAVPDKPRYVNAGIFCPAWSKKGKKVSKIYAIMKSVKK